MSILGGEVRDSYTVNTTDVPYAKRTVKHVKLGWFDRWFMKKAKEAWENAREEREMMADAKTPVAMANDFDYTSGATTFTVTACDGGFLISTRYIDGNTFEPRVKRYIVPDGVDVGKRIGEIFTFEAIKR